jgi:molybdopterin-containing oxidoreductase family membrane subunit
MQRTPRFSTYPPIAKRARGKSDTMQKYRIALVLPVLVALVGLGFWIYQIQEGLILTNMRNSFSWGLYVAMWAFFVGTAAGGLIVTSAVYLFKAESLKPVAKIASLTAFICTIAAMGMLLPDLGRIDRIFNLVIYPSFSSVLVWDFIVLATYAILAAGYTYVQIRPDIASRGIRLPLLGTIGKKEMDDEELDRMKKQSERQARYIAPVALVVAVLIHTITAWVLATQLGRSWWFGGALAPAFIASAIASGPVVVILAALYTLRRPKELASAYMSLAKIAVFGAVVLLFIYYNDFLVRSWWRGGAETETVRLIFNEYLWVHIAELALIVGAIILLLKRARSMVGLVAGSLCMGAGVLVHRFLLLPSAYNVIPFKVPVATNGELTEWAYPTAVGEITGTLDSPSPLFVSWWGYVPSPVEFTIAAGMVAAVILVYAGLSRMLPIATGRK